MEINDEIFLAYHNCKYKASLLSKEKKEKKKNDFDKFYSDALIIYKKSYKENINKEFLDFKGTEVNKSEILNSNFEYFLNIKLKIGNRITIIDSIKKLSLKSIDHSIIKTTPLVIRSYEKVQKIDRLLLTYKSILVEETLGTKINTGIVLFGKKGKTINIKITNSLKSEVANYITEINRILERKIEPNLILNEHCQMCEFKDYCHKKATEKDDISLLKTLKGKEIRDLNNKGIFTVNQFSYTFRPRKQLKKVRRKVKRHHPALKALAIREKKVFIYDKPKVPQSPTKIYLDIEGVPDRNLIYLIGLVVEKKGVLEKHTIWLNKEEENKQVLIDFLEFISSYKKITIYHYGSYETKFFRLLTNTFPESGTVKRVVESSVNVLSLIYPSIYFPTYSNGLKDIAKYLGFKWFEENLTGLESILLRNKWELTKESSLKTSLVSYNIDDCFALRIITNFLIAVSSNENIKSEFPKIQITDDFRDEIRARYGGHKFEVPDFVLDNFDYINKCSYFDYQRSKIFFKTESKIRKANDRNDKRKTKFPKIHNTEVNIRKHSTCPRCKSVNIRIAAKVNSKIVVDIKFFKGGIKKWITKYNSQKHQCRDCLKSYFPNKYKNIGVKYGHNLISWVVSQHIVNGISFGKIESNLADYFQISVGSVGGESLYRFKTLAANYYKREYNSLLAKVKNWKRIHVDETRVRVQGLPGYIWVLTDMTNVVYIYTETRKTDVIASIIKGTTGVLISDFYKGYEAMECPQQKCLVHLIRDINDNLFKYQQNEELKIIAQKFSSLLKLIVDTSKKYGLKKRYLLKHKKNVLKFYNFLRNTTFESDIAKKLEKRFIKYENQLFTFLEYDGVPWNNNNAEHAFKHFASYRRNTNGIFTENGLKNYLILLSIYQTCNYGNIDFLKFLLSKEKHINIYERKYTRYGNLRKGCRPHSSIY